MAHRGNDGSSLVYQIDFTALATGKRIASTKRRVRWRFGFTNLQALQAGETGTACRGEEHDVTLVWSITSGKRLVLADGQEVHYSISRNNDFDCSWTMRGGHVLKLVAHASPPIGAPPGFRQYDFFIDGQSFFSMPKVYRLGLSTGRGAGAGGGGGTRHGTHSYGGARPASASDIAAIEAPHNPEEEEAYLQEAIKQSLQDNRKKEEAAPALPPSEPPKKEEENLLLDFFDAPAPAPASAAPLALPAPADQNGFGSSNPQPNYSDTSSDFGFAATAPASFAPAPAASYTGDIFGYDPASRSNYTQQPGSALTPATTPALTYGQASGSTSGYSSSFQSATAQQMNTPFTSSYTAPQPAPAPQPASTPFDFATQQPASAAGISGSSSVGSFGPSMNPPAPAAANADQGYKNLASMTDFNLSSKSESSNPFGSSSASQPTLGQMKMMGGSGAQAPKQDVMKPPPTDALVVSGTQSGNWSGYAQYGMQQTNQPSSQGYGQSQSQSGGQYGGYGGIQNSGGYGNFGPQQQTQQFGQYQYGQQQQSMQYGQQQQPQQYGQQQQPQQYGQQPQQFGQQQQPQQHGQFQQYGQYQQSQQYGQQQR